jgi:hypothetical protein
MLDGDQNRKTVYYRGKIFLIKNRYWANFPATQYGVPADLAFCGAIY